MATKIEGLDRLNRKLKRMPDLARQEIAKAMEKSAQEIVEMAKGLAPSRTGALRDSIGWNWYGAPEGSMVLGEVRSSGRGAGNLAIVIYAGDDKAYYARWQEFGTTAMRAPPFFFPAYRANRKRVRSRISRAITTAAKRTASGG
jgi:HK97 gp10 family phage protein